MKINGCWLSLNEVCIFMKGIFKSGFFVKSIVLGLFVVLMFMLVGCSDSEVGDVFFGFFIIKDIKIDVF